MRKPPDSSPLQPPLLKAQASQRHQGRAGKRAHALYMVCRLDGGKRAGFYRLGTVIHKVSVLASVIQNVWEIRESSLRIGYARQARAQSKASWRPFPAELIEVRAVCALYGNRECESV